jgi:hypothetical protein
MSAPFTQVSNLVCTTPAVRECLGFGTLTLTGTAALLSSIEGGIPYGARIVVFSIESANARFRDDIVSPTSSVGVLLVTGTAPGSGER